MTDTPLYNSRIMYTYVKLVEKKYPQVDLDNLLHEAGLQIYAVSDEGHWLSQKQVNLFYERLVQATGNHNIAREAGRYAASADCVGFIRRYLLGMIGPANGFNAINKVSSRFTRSSCYSSRKIGANKVEIIVTPVGDSRESPFQCENRWGVFEAILATYHCTNPKIEHPECLFKGGQSCRYVISWKKTLPLRIRSVRNYLLLALFVLAGSLATSLPWHVLAAFLPMTGLVLLIFSYAANIFENRDLAAGLASLKENAEELLDQAGVNYNNALMVNDVGQAISKQAGIDEVLHNVIKALEVRLTYDRGLILLADPEKARLQFRIGFGYSEEQLSFLIDTSFSLTNPESKEAFIVCFREQKPILINDFSEASVYHSTLSLLLAEKIGVQSFICCAIVCDGESLGILAVDNIKTKKALVQSDMSLLTGIAPVIGMSLRNAMYIDREREMADQMRQSQKMEAVGQLAGGIAHDFNNLLTAIMGFTTLAQSSVGVNDDASKQYLKEVQLASQRATHLTQGLLAFSRQKSINPVSVDLNDIVEGIEKLLRRLISEEIELLIQLGQETLLVVVDPGQIDQIIMNLATNARDAMDNSGVLTIATGSVELSSDFVTAQGYGAPGQYARISVTDTGMGMDEATKARIFEPFFTTKEVGKGTGLGLAIVYGIVKQHNGYIEIVSKVGEGTTFNIYLPLPEKEAALTQRSEARENLRRGSETILVVEDAPEVRRLTKHVLENNGYRVIEAVDGQDSLEQFEMHQDDIDLVIMDVIMPRLNGKDAFAEMDRMRPGTRVLFTSGYTPDDVSRKGVLFEEDNFIAKPCSPDRLLSKVRDLLA